MVVRQLSHPQEKAAETPLSPGRGSRMDTLLHILTPVVVPLKPILPGFCGLTGAGPLGWRWGVLRQRLKSFRVLSRRDRIVHRVET
jgi:hypothetical protein